MAFANKDADLDALAKFAEHAKAEGDPSGFITGGFIFSDFAIVLRGCVKFDSEIPEFECKRIITKIVLDPALPSPITAASLLQECSKHEKAYLAQPKRDFRLLTEVSLSWSIDVPRVVIGNITLTFRPKQKTGFAARSKLFKDVRGSMGFDLPPHYMQLSAHVNARTPNEAAERGLYAIDLARASWNLLINRGKSWRHSGGKPNPINDIRLSPFHTIHDIHGKPVEDTYWYDPSYSRPADIYSDKVMFEQLTSAARNLRTRLTKSPYRSEIEDALIRYVRALDSADLNDEFLRLWSLLEFLTDSTKDPYKVAIRRAGFMFADNQRAKLILTHLTNYRNRFVHAGAETDDIESLVFQLKRFVDELLLFHIGNAFRFTSRSDAAKFMDHSPSSKDLNLQIKGLHNAKKFIGKGT